MRAVKQVEVMRECAGAVEHGPDGRWPIPMAHVQAGIVQQGSAAPYEDGTVLGTQFVHQHGGELVGEADGRSARSCQVNEVIG